MKSLFYYAGYDGKSKEINEAGWEFARDKFNSENPPGQKWTGSENAFDYAKGEFQAICDKSPYI